MYEGLAERLAGAGHREQLAILRDHLAARLDDAPPRDQAPIAAQLKTVLDDLARMPIIGEGSKLDDLAARRTARHTGTATTSSA